MFLMSAMVLRFGPEDAFAARVWPGFSGSRPKTLLPLRIPPTNPPEAERPLARTGAPVGSLPVEEAWTLMWDPSKFWVTFL